MVSDFYSVEFKRDISLDGDESEVDEVFVEEIWRDSNGSFSRPGDLPARTLYQEETGTPLVSMWYKGGVLHREGDKPAVMDIEPSSGVVLSEVYSCWGARSREDGKPAVIERDPENRILRQEFWVNDQRHRTDGPAVEIYDPQTLQLVDFEYWVNGEQIDPPTPSSERPCRSIPLIDRKAA